MIRFLPSVFRYNASWTTYKKSQPYRTLISESLVKLDDLRNKLAMSKKDFSELEEELVKRYDLSDAIGEKAPESSEEETKAE